MPLLASFFGHGAFKAIDVLQTQKSLVTLALGVPAFMMVKVLAPGFYAQQDIKTPVKVGAYCMLLNTLLCAIFIWPLAHAGLTLASALASYANAGALLALLWRRGAYRPSPGWKQFFGQLFFANTALAAYLLCSPDNITVWMSRAMGGRFLHLLTYILFGFILYVLCLGLTGVRFTQFRGHFLEK